MRPTWIGATGSNIHVRSPLTRARAWAVALVTVLVCGDAQFASALKYQQTQSRLTTIKTGFQPDALTSPASGGTDSAAPPAPAIAGFSATYWSALTDVDLATLRRSAQSELETRFAEAMLQLANGDIEGAERGFTVASRQRTDVNVAVAAQVMLATTLRYERKWSQLRDLPLTSLLSAQDKLMTSDLEQWGKAFANAEPQVIEFPSEPLVMPLKITTVGTPMIRVSINGNLYDFWLDTGSSMTVISSAVAADANIAALSDDTMMIRTFAGSAPVKAAFVKRIEIGSIVVKNCPAVIIDESLMYLRTSEAGVPERGIHVDGIIGWDTLREFDLTMDYNGGSIELAKPVRRTSAVGTDRTLAWLGRPTVEIGSKLGGKLHFTLDTGAQSSFLNATAIEKAGATPQKADSHVFGIAKTGRRTERVVPFLTVTIGNKQIQLEDVIVYGPDTSGLMNSDGFLGSDLGRFGLIHIDATNGVFTVGELGRLEDPTE